MLKRLLAVAVAVCFFGANVWAATTTSSTSSMTTTQTATYNALSSASSNTAVSSVLTSLSNLPSSQQGTALTQLSGVTTANSVPGVQAGTQVYQAQVQGRAQEIRTGGGQYATANMDMPEGAAGPAKQNLGLGVWAQGIFAWEDQDNDAQEGEIKLGYDSDTAGFVVGIDKALDRWVVGVSTGCTWTDVDTNDVPSETDIFAWQIGPYVSFNEKKWYVDAGFTYSDGDIDTKRKIEFLGVTADGDTDSDTWSFYVGGGYTFAFGKFTLTPTANLSYSTTDIDSYTEKNAGGANLHIDETDSDSTVLRIGIRPAYQFNKRFSVNGTASWNHDFSVDRPKTHANFIGGAQFETTGLKPEDWSYTLGIGCVGKITDTINAFANYDFTGSDDLDSHNLSIGIRFDF